MKITLTLHDGREAAGKPPYVGAPNVEFKEFRCECSQDQPLLVVGRGRSRTLDDAMVESSAGCYRCGGDVGVLRAESGTLFGVDEDARVLGGPWKVF